MLGSEHAELAETYAWSDEMKQEQNKEGLTLYSVNGWTWDSGKLHAPQKDVNIYAEVIDSMED